MIGRSLKLNDNIDKYLRRLIWISLLWSVSLLFLSACGKTELEQRCFPLLAVSDFETEGKRSLYSFYVGFPRANNEGGSTGQSKELEISSAKAGSFGDSKKAFEENLSKVPDYNHLKVLVLGKDLAQNERALKAMLNFLTKTEEFPRNTYVCVVEDVEGLLKIDKELPQDLGTYLEEYLVKHEAKQSRLLTLGDLMDEMKNGELVLYAPFLSPKENYVEWEGYYALGFDLPPTNLQ